MRILDNSGYPIGDLWLLFWDMHPNELRSDPIDNTEIYKRMGIPKERWLTVGSILLGTKDHSTMQGIPRDIFMGLNMPKKL